MSVAGTWNVYINTPMGNQKSVLVVSEGPELAGTMSSPAGNYPIYDVTVDGATFNWSVNFEKPLKMTAKFQGTVEDDAMTGRAKAGVFPASDFKAEREPA